MCRSLLILIESLRRHIDWRKSYCISFKFIVHKFALSGQHSTYNRHPMTTLVACVPHEQRHRPQEWYLTSDYLGRTNSWFCVFLPWIVTDVILSDSAHLGKSIGASQKLCLHVRRSSIRRICNSSNQYHEYHHMSSLGGAHPAIRSDGLSNLDASCIIPSIASIWHSSVSMFPLNLQHHCGILKYQRAEKNNGL